MQIFSHKQNLTFQVKNHEQIKNNSIQYVEKQKNSHNNYVITNNLTEMQNLDSAEIMTEFLYKCHLLFK